MHIDFKEIYIHNFKSLGENIKINLADQGIVTVRGINNSLGTASSNGSGKSSIFDAIYWTIYGKTTSGISDPSNRYASDGCYTKLIFEIDGYRYTIIRSIKSSKYKTSLSVYKGDDDISGRNKTDTEKIIKSDVINISSDIFLSIIYLEQDFSSRLGKLQPLGRKERIEVLSDTNSQIEEFKAKIITTRTKYSDKVISINNDVSYRRGSRSSIVRQIDKINEDKEKLKNRPDMSNIDQLKKKYELFCGMQEGARNQLSKTTSDIYTINSKLSQSANEVRRLESDIQNINRVMNNMSTDKTCPTCKQLMAEETSSQLTADYNNKICSCQDEISRLNDLINGYQDKKNELLECEKLYKDKVDRTTPTINALQKTIAEIEAYANISDNSEELGELSDELERLDSELADLDKEVEELDSKISVANHCVTLVTKQFRGYLLTNIISFMNNRLKEYSEILFGEGNLIIRLEVDSIKLDIYVGDALYDTLSGGERRKVDLALVMAQRDLAINTANLSSNILILDESLENMDEVATHTALELLQTVSEDIDSMFIISHNNYSIGYDNQICVEKSSNNISNILISN